MIENKCDCKSIYENKVLEAKKHICDIELINRLEIFYKAFADSTRLKIMSILDNVGSMCVCDIAVSLNMTKSAISHQLKYLKLNGLLRCEKQGKEVMYMVADEHIRDIFEKGVEHLGELNI